MRSVIAYGLVLTFGCAAALPPADLVTARGSYDRASHGPAASLDPTDLHTAKLSLDSAERAFADEGDTSNTRDLAYTADRLTQVAEAHARGMQSDQQRAAVVDQMNQNQTATVRNTSAALRGANQQLASAGQQLQSQGQQMAAQRQQLESRAAAPRGRREARRSGDRGSGAHREREARDARASYHSVG